MTGPLDSVIGVRKEDALARFKLGIANRFQIAKGDPVFCAVVLDLDEQTGRAAGITRVWEEMELDNKREDEEEE
jgi:calcineurin-like phosphoesterase